MDRIVDSLATLALFVGAVVVIGFVLWLHVIFVFGL